MSSETKEEIRPAAAGWIVRPLTVLSCLALAVLLVVTFASVIMRYVFNAPIMGSNEIIQLASVALVMLAMPGAAHAEQHIRVDVMDGMIGAAGRLAGDILARAISVYLLWVLCWRTWDKMLEAAEFGDTTNMLAIPLWPFYGLLILGCGLYGLVLIIQLAGIVRKGASRNE